MLGLRNSVASPLPCIVVRRMLWTCSCSDLITSARVLDNSARFRLAFTENIAGGPLTLYKNVLAFGSWPVLVMWFGGAIQVYIDV
jgi:hypothetical protein